MPQIKVRSLILAASLLVALPSIAKAATLENGTYRCIIDAFSMHLGDIEIDGSTYRGPAYDGAYEGDYRFSLSPEGAITWNGPLGGISASGTIVSSTVNDLGFDIIFKNDSGSFQTVSCHH